MAPLIDMFSEYHVFDLDQFTGLGRHRPYYKVVGYIIAKMLLWNQHYGIGEYEHVREMISNEIHLYDNPPSYMEDDPMTIVHIERAVLHVLKYIHLDERVGFFESKSEMYENLIIIGVNSWT